MKSPKCPYPRLGRPFGVTSFLSLGGLFCLVLFLGYGHALAQTWPCPCREEERDLLLTHPRQTGRDVSDLQRALKEMGLYSSDITGVFGPITEATVKALQEYLDLPSDGVFAREERRALTVVLASEKLALGTAPPPAGELRLEIDIAKRKLALLADDEAVKTYSCAVGKAGTPTPVGEWCIIQKGTNWGGGFGTRWLGLNIPWGIYGIHGTNDPTSIGTAASAGCIRLQNRDVEELYSWLKVGTRVSILGPYPVTPINRPLRAGQTGKEVQTLQLRLRDYGFDPGYTDGRFGPDTENAIKRLQLYYGLRQSGEADKNTLLLLGL